MTTEALIDALLDDAISEEDFQRLESILETDPTARALYYDRLQLHTALELTVEEGVSPTIAFPTQKRRRWLWPARIAAAIAVLGTAVGFGWFSGRQPAASNTQASVESIARGFAVIADQSEATWALSRGDLIPQGSLTLESGTVQLDLFSGVTVIVEGAAKFEIVSAMEMHVDQGKVRALVPPPAHGFRLRTADGEVVDLGTEFAIDVQDDHADIHILDGEIEWHPNDQTMQTFVGGQAIRWSTDGHGTPLSFDAEQFARIAEMEQSLAAQRQDRRQAWLSQAQRCQEDPRVVAYFPMTQAGDWTRQLKDASDHRHDGTIVRALPVADRWEHSQAALDFSPTGSRVRLDVPGTYEALTFYCWTKIDSLDRWYNSLFLTDGHELHEPHWQIMNDGRLFFSVKAHDRKGPGSPDKHICYSPSFWTPNLSGQWIQVATTFDSATKEVVHYVNGEVISLERVPDDMLVNTIRIGAASIGNWSEPKRNDPDFAMRNLNGAIDEFLIFSSALDASEIAQLYHTGRP